MKFEDIKVGEEYLVDGQRLLCFEKTEEIEDNCKPCKTIIFTNENKTMRMYLGEKDLHRVDVFINLKDWDVSTLTDFGKSFENIRNNPSRYEVGKVYKNKEDNHLFYVTELNEERQPLGYGFIPGIFVEFDKTPWDDEFLDFDTELATQIEWQEALIKEAKKRGYKFTSIHVCGYNEVIISDNQGNLSTIFKDGEWAEIIKEKPKTNTTFNMEIQDWNVSEANKEFFESFTKNSFQLKKLKKEEAPKKHGFSIYKDSAIEELNRRNLELNKFKFKLIKEKHDTTIKLIHLEGYILKLNRLTKKSKKELIEKIQEIYKTL